MRDQVRVFLAAFAIVALLAGLAVKADRYASPGIPGAADFATTLAARFEAARSAPTCSTSIRHS